MAFNKFKDDEKDFGKEESKFHEKGESKATEKAEDKGKFPFKFGKFKKGGFKKFVKKVAKKKYY